MAACRTRLTTKRLWSGNECGVALQLQTSLKGAIMTQRPRCSTKFMIHSMIAAALITVAACNSTPSSKSAGSTSDSAGARFDVLCIGDRISNPPESFHYSYKHEDASGSTENEADITPQTMEITIRDKSGSHQYHGVRSDE